ALLTLRPGFSRLWDERTRRLLRLLHCWTWANLLFWTIVPGHRPRHGLPLQPGLAGLAALVWIAWLSGRLRWPVPRVRRVADWASVPGPAYCALVEGEWRRWPSDRPARLLGRLRDEQGGPIVLIQLGTDPQ